MAGSWVVITDLLYAALQSPAGIRDWLRGRLTPRRICSFLASSRFLFTVLISLTIPALAPAVSILHLRPHRSRGMAASDGADVLVVCNQIAWKYLGPPPMITIESVAAPR